jgi:Spy/CpxP family protein refolding chaperone
MSATLQQPGEANMSEDTANEQTIRTSVSRRGKRALIIGGVVTSALVMAAVGSAALSQGPWGGPPPLMGESMDPARFEEQADRMIRHMAVEIDATAEQQEKLRANVKSAVRDLLPLREKVASTHERSRLLLIQPTVDREALERLRVEQLGLVDAGSKRFAQALGDIATVLTLEQRRALDDRMTRMREQRGAWSPWRRG